MMFVSYHNDVRTTLTLDDDVAAKIKEVMNKRGITFKEAVNSVLRSGLNIKTEKPSKPFKVHPKDLSPKISVDYDNIGALLEQVEGASHK